MTPLSIFSVLFFQSDKTLFTMYYINPPAIWDSFPLDWHCQLVIWFQEVLSILSSLIIHVLYGNKNYLNDSQKKYCEEEWSYSLPESQILGHRRDIVATPKILSFSEKV